MPALRSHRRTAFAALGAPVALAATPAAAGAGGDTRAAPPPRAAPAPPVQTAALHVAATGAPRRVAGSDGLTHTEYDLLLTNVFTAPVTLTAVEVLSPDEPAGAPLLRLEGAALAAVTQPLLGGPPTAEVPVSGAVATVVDLVLPPGAVPPRVTHRITYAAPPDAPYLTLLGTRRIDGPELALDPRAAPVIAPPLRGAGWLDWNGCDVVGGDYMTNHRWFRLAVAGAGYVKPETFAIDWMRLRGGQFFSGDGSRVEQYFGFGAEVVAAAGGTVVSVRDGMPEETPNQPPVAVRGPGDYAGNHVVVQQGSGVWALYAHLQPGSISVRVGDRVAAGQGLGRLGNTGNSSAPHLHFQLSDSPDVTLTFNSLPFVLDRYTLAGSVTDSALAAMNDPRPPTLAVAGPPRPQTETHPLLFTVADFR